MYLSRDILRPVGGVSGFQVESFGSFAIGPRGQSRVFGFVSLNEQAGGWLKSASSTSHTPEEECFPKRTTSPARQKRYEDAGKAIQHSNGECTIGAQPRLQGSKKATMNSSFVVFVDRSMCDALKGVGMNGR